MRLLCVADVHLGNVPTRLPAHLAGRVPELGPAAAWRRAVDVALEQQVCAVLLAGDLVHGGNDFFEAFSALRDGAMRLANAGVQVLAVAGNHDTEVLSRLVKAVPQVRLVGAGGRWEAVDVVSAGGECVRVLGWSFPARWVEESPLRGSGVSEALAAADALAAEVAVDELGAGAQRTPPRATLGLLHADRDQTGSRYAPVSSAQLASAPVSAWLMGHVHKPDASEAERAWGRGGYLGSLTACDPGEHGARGAWLLEVAPNGAVSMRHVPLAPLRWEELSIDISGLTQAEEVTVLLASSLEQLVRDLDTGGMGHRPVALGCRVSLVGRSTLRGQIEAVLDAEAVIEGATPVNGTEVFVDRVRIEALPAADLQDLANDGDPLGLLAQRVLALREPTSEMRQRLVAQARPSLELVSQARWANGVENPPLSDDEVAQLLEEAALRALDALLGQLPNHARGGQASVEARQAAGGLPGSSRGAQPR